MGVPGALACPGKRLEKGNDLAVSDSGGDFRKCGGGVLGSLLLSRWLLSWSNSSSSSGTMEGSDEVLELLLPLPLPLEEEDEADSWVSEEDSVLILPFSSTSTPLSSSAGTISSTTFGVDAAGVESSTAKSAADRDCGSDANAAAGCWAAAGLEPSTAKSAADRDFGSDANADATAGCWAAAAAVGLESSTAKSAADKDGVSDDVVAATATLVDPVDTTASTDGDAASSLLPVAAVGVGGGADAGAGAPAAC